MTDAHTWNELSDETTASRLENKWSRALQAKPERDLIYLASPYGGKHENFIRAQRDMMILTETYRQHDFISPIVSFGFCYDNYSYDDGIQQCLGLLSHCDQLWILHDDGISKGVKIERKFAAEHNIPIKETSETVN